VRDGRGALFAVVLCDRAIAQHERRLLARQPGFTAVAILSLGLGVGVNTTIFSVVNAVLFKPSAVEDADRLVEIYSGSGEGYAHLTSSYPDYVDLRDSADSFSAMAAHAYVSALLTRGGRSESILGEIVTANYFDVLGARTARGRTILPEEAGAAEAGGEHGEDLYGVVPWVRTASTDLNFTLALALVSVVMTQVIGVRALGLGYFSKFFDFGGFVKLWSKEDLGPFDVMMPFLDIFVGILELVAEIAKIISFSFRLFGNIFAGTILLFVIGSLVPVLVQSGVLMLEFAVGLIQALVFGMLTLVFMTIATQGHGHDDEGHEEAHA
jgi:hypothetical protein